MNAHTNPQRMDSWYPVIDKGQLLLAGSVGGKRFRTTPITHVFYTAEGESQVKTIAGIYWILPLPSEAVKAQFVGYDTTDAVALLADIMQRLHKRKSERGDRKGRFTK